MKPKGDFWKIECCQHTRVIFSAKVKVANISEKKLVEFIRVLMVKYALSDNEILEQYLRIYFKPAKDYQYSKISRYY